MFAIIWSFLFYTVHCYMASFFFVLYFFALFCVFISFYSLLYIHNSPFFWFYNIKVRTLCNMNDRKRAQKKMSFIMFFLVFPMYFGWCAPENTLFASIHGYFFLLLFRSLTLYFSSSHCLRFGRSLFHFSHSLCAHSTTAIFHWTI